MMIWYYNVRGKKTIGDGDKVVADGATLCGLEEDTMVEGSYYYVMDCRATLKIGGFHWLVGCSVISFCHLFYTIVINFNHSLFKISPFESKKYSINIIVHEMRSCTKFINSYTTTCLACLYGWILPIFDITVDMSESWRLTMILQNLQSVAFLKSGWIIVILAYPF
jgi:hypothetical protein